MMSVGDKMAVGRSRRAVALATSAMLLALVAGCANVGRVTFHSLDYKHLPDGAPLFEVEQPDEAWWWTEDNVLYIAMSRGETPADEMAPREQFDLSLVFPGLPQEDAREYRFGQATLRAFEHDKAEHKRFASLEGIADIRFQPGGLLRGRFRCQAKAQAFHILTSWADQPVHAIAGEFVALPDTGRGRAILERTEDQGMERGPAIQVPMDAVPLPRKVTGPPVNADNS